MPSWIFALFAILLAVSVVAMLMQRRGPKIGAGVGGNFVAGTLTVTGVSDRGAADKTGNAYVSFSGTITGEQTAPTEVYGTLTVSAGELDPHVGQDFPVVYKPGKAATSWRLGNLT